MMPSAVLSYIQMGHFLMLVMTVSWAFSTFFFQSLCSIAGPQGDWGQLSWAQIRQFCCGCGKPGAEKRDNAVHLQKRCPEVEVEKKDLNREPKSNNSIQCQGEPLLYTSAI